MLKFRKLAAGDVQVRSAVKPNGVLILMYKNARVDMAILDETVGPFNWQRQHEGKFCKVSIKNPDTGEWVTKEDAGFCDSPDPEMQKKGEASDAFKRACSSWGIGRELYSAPMIWFSASELKGFHQDPLKDDDHFTVEDITYDGDRIASVKVSASCRGYGKYLTKTFGKAAGTPSAAHAAPVSSDKDDIMPASAEASVSTASTETKPPEKKKFDLPFSDDTTLLIEELKGKRLGDVKNTKAFIRFLKWTTTRNVEYSSPEENEQFRKFKELAEKIFKAA